jgi:hypothetical protein
MEFCEIDPCEPPELDLDRSKWAFFDCPDASPADSAPFPVSQTPAPFVTSVFTLCPKILESIL